MAVSVESVSLLLLSLLDVPWICCLPSALCPHTAFYHGCWIRRFPGIVLSFSGSEQRGARLLQRRPETSAQMCSRKCCHQDSCNVAVFYIETSAESGDCHLVHCPEPESCLLQLRERSILYTVTAGKSSAALIMGILLDLHGNHKEVANFSIYSSESATSSTRSQQREEVANSLLRRECSVLYTVTEVAVICLNFGRADDHRVSPLGVDPDLLVFDQLEQIDLNPRSSLKWERLNISRVPPTLGPSKEPQSLPTSPHDEPTATQPPPLQPPSPADSPLRSLAPTYSPPITAQDTTSVFPRGAEMPDQEAPPSSPPLDRPELQSPAHLDSSKQHVNETKGHGGRNQTYDGEIEDPTDTWASLWPLPTMIGSTVTLLCCCSGVLAFGCCRRRRRGRYRPWRAPRTAQGPSLLALCSRRRTDPRAPRWIIPVLK
ncbi:unnamed protein product, partial [Ranitomeya imitator]